MADTVRMTDATGQAFDIPKEMAAKAESDGLKPEGPGLVSQGLDLLRGAVDATPINRVAYSALGVADSDLAAKRKAAQPASNDVAMVGPDGSSYMMPPDVAEKAKADGFKPATEQQAATAEYLSQPENQGARGAGKVLQGKVTSEYLMGLPEMAAKAAMTGQENADWEALKEKNPTASAVGSAEGIVGNMLTPGVNMAGLAGKAGKAAQFGGEATSLAGKALQGAVKLGAEGAVYSAPRTAGELLLAQDPEKAAETLLVGVGVSALFGSVGALGKAGLKAGSGAMAGRAEALVAKQPEAVAAKLAEASAAKVTQAEAEAANAARVAAESYGAPGVVEAADAAAKNVIAVKAAQAAEAAAKVAEAAPEAEQTLAGKALDYAKGKLVDHALNTAASSFGPLGYGVKALAKGAYKLGTDDALQAKVLTHAASVARSIDSVAPALEEIGTKAATASSGEWLAQMSGKPDASKQEQFQAITDKLARLSADPEHRVDSVSRLTAPFDPLHPDAASAMTMKLNSAVDYLYGAMPKNPAMPGPFEATPKWRPSDAELDRYGRRVEVALNPFVVVERMKQGTLTKEHVEALDALYPQLAGELRKRVLEKAADPKALVLSRTQRAQVGTLLGTPPRSVAAYQAMYSTDQSGDGSGGSSGGVKKMGALPGATPSAAQKLATR